MKKMLTVLMLLLAGSTYCQSVDDFLNTFSDLKKAKGKWLGTVHFDLYKQKPPVKLYILGIGEDNIIFSNKRKLKFSRFSVRDHLVSIPVNDISSIVFGGKARSKSQKTGVILLGPIVGAGIASAFTDSGGGYLSSIDSNVNAFAIGLGAGLVGGIIASTFIKEKSVNEQSIKVVLNDDMSFEELQLDLLEYQMERKYQ